MKIIAVGWNYPKHNHELGVSESRPAHPVIFMKPETALLKGNEDFYIPDFSGDVQYETEVVYRITKMGKNIAPEFARRYYDAVGLGIDFTARDLQNRFRKDGSPWELSKAFDNSAPVSELLPIDDFASSQSLHFSLRLNGDEVQTGDTADMFFSIDQIISYVSGFITLKSGDLIFTGTPQGVGSVSVGDRLVGYLEGREMFNFRVC